MRNPLRSVVRIAALSAGTALCAFGLSLIGATDLLVHLEGDSLRITAPHLDFLSGKPLQRLKDGASVAFIGQLTISTSPNSLSPAARSVARFAVSYDIWEERFSVTKIGQKPDSRRTISHLSSPQMAEDWCFENLTIDSSQIPPDKPFYIQLDLRAEDPQDLSFIGDPGINITRLIEIFGRPGRSAQPRWVGTSGPYRLEDLKKFETKGTRG